MSQFSELHKQLVIASSIIKDRLNEYDESHMTFEVEVSGRINGDLKLVYKLGEYGCDVKGADLEAVIDEYIHRKGWKKRNDPVAIPYMKRVESTIDTYVPIHSTVEE